MVFGEFEGARQLELVALAEVLDRTGAKEALTPWWGKGIVVPAWRWKVKDWRMLLVPYEIRGDFEYLLWFQSPHPDGGVPDLMISKPPWKLEGDVLHFSGVPAWRLPRRPLSWRPEIVIEVKKRGRQCNKYAADVRIMVSEEVVEVEGWETVEPRELGRRVREVLEERGY